MEQNSTSSRLHALDGIRGIAIILVVLNHVKVDFLVGVLPHWLDFILFNSGVTGVTLLFILSGFLMTYIYPNPQNGLHFLQKRYTRIFPLFITASLIMMILREFPYVSWYWQIFIFISFAFLTYVIWVFIIKRFASLRIKKIIFLSFIFLQVIVGGFYLFWVMRHPPIVFNQQLPFIIRELTIFLVNITLTLPLGNYILMLQGVYWSLVAEVLFYILYPFVCVPLIHFFSLQKRVVKISVLLLLIPFFEGLDLISHKLFVLSMLQPAICYYFVAGILLGYIYKHHESFIQKAHNIFSERLAYVSILLFILIITVKVFVLSAVLPYLDSYIHMLWAFPVIFIVGVALDEKTKLSKMLKSKILVFLGTISYSIYLSHTPILHMVQSTFHATNAFTNFLQLFLTLTITILISIVWYHFLERPYFKRNKVKEIITVSIHNKFIQKPVFILSLIFIIYFFSIFNAYQSNFNFFSIQYLYNNSIFINPKILSNTKNISSVQYPQIDLLLKAVQNNFAVITMHVKDVKYVKLNQHQDLTFKIKEQGQKNWYATDTFNLNIIGDSPTHPFGFPLITDAKGKNYQVELSTLDPTLPEYMLLDTSSVRGIYEVNKGQLLKHPLQLIQFIVSRVNIVVQDKEAETVVALGMPIIILSFIILFYRKKYSYVS